MDKGSTLGRILSNTIFVIEENKSLKVDIIFEEKKLD